MTSLGRAICPGCPVGEEARRLVFDDGFWPTLLVAAAPLVVTLALVLIVLRFVDARRPRSSLEERTDA